MILAEKGLDFESREVNLMAGEQHAPDYVKLNPNHVVPTLVDEGQAFVDSTLINEYLDDKSPIPPMRSADPVARYRAAALVHYVDTQLHGKVTGVLTHSILTKPMLSSRPPEQIEGYLNAIPDPAERALRRSLITHGVDAPEVPGAIETLSAFFARLETELAEQPWLAGADFGLADACVLPYVVRFADMGLNAFWADGARPVWRNGLTRRWPAPASRRHSSIGCQSRWPARSGRWAVRCSRELPPSLSRPTRARRPE